MIQSEDYTLPEGRNMIRFNVKYDNNTKLDAVTAKEMFSKSYDGQNYYNYRKGTSTSFSGKLNIRHMMFLIIFLELLANCRIKYEIC